MGELSVPESIMPALFANAGMIVMNWAFVENSLDYWTAIAFHDHNGSTIEPELPRQFGRKITFLRKAFRRLPGLHQFQDEAIGFLDRARHHSNVRHYIVHGVLSGFDAADDETFIFRKIDIDENKTQHVAGTLRIKGAALIAVANDLLAMAQTGQSVAQRMLDALE
jgi:hypothetical protein